MLWDQIITIGMVDIPLKTAVLTIHDSYIRIARYITETRSLSRQTLDELQTLLLRNEILKRSRPQLMNSLEIVANSGYLDDNSTSNLRAALNQNFISLAEIASRGRTMALLSTRQRISPFGEVLSKALKEQSVAFSSILDKKAYDILQILGSSTDLPSLRRNFGKISDENDRGFPLVRSLEQALTSQIDDIGNIDFIQAINQNKNKTSFEYLLSRAIIKSSGNTNKIVNSIAFIFKGKNITPIGVGLIMIAGVVFMIFCPAGKNDKDVVSRLSETSLHILSQITQLTVAQYGIKTIWGVKDLVVDGYLRGGCPRLISFIPDFLFKCDLKGTIRSVQQAPSEADHVIRQVLADGGALDAAKDRGSRVQLAGGTKGNVSACVVVVFNLALSLLIMYLFSRIPGPFGAGGFFTPDSSGGGSGNSTNLTNYTNSSWP